jgi:hypothetical protein
MILRVNEPSIVGNYRCAFLIGSSCSEKRNSYSVINNELLSYLSILRTLFEKTFPVNG